MARTCKPSKRNKLTMKFVKQLRIDVRPKKRIVSPNKEFLNKLLKIVLKRLRSSIVKRLNVMKNERRPKGNN